MTAVQDTYNELNGNIFDLRGDAIPIHFNRIVTDDGSERGARYNVPYITLDEVGIDPIVSTNASDFIQVQISIYSRTTTEDISHDMGQVRAALLAAKNSVRRAQSTGIINDYKEAGVSPGYIRSFLLIARGVPRDGV